MPKQETTTRFTTQRWFESNDYGKECFVDELLASHGSLLAALEECQRLAIDRVRTADTAVKSDVYAADALMGIAKTAHDAIAAAKGEVS